MNEIIERLERETGVSGLVSLLAERLGPPTCNCFSWKFIAKVRVSETPLTF
jgi:hypothetical protein